MSKNVSNVSKLIFIVWCLLEIFIFGALHFGWASLAYILKKDNYFYNGCVNSNWTTEASRQPLSCSYQDGQLSLLYSVSSGIMIIPIVLCGTLIDRIGVVKTRLIYTFIFATGCASAIASSNARPWLMAVSVALLGSGGRVFFLTSAQAIYNGYMILLFPLRVVSGFIEGCLSRIYPGLSGNALKSSILETGSLILMAAINGCYDSSAAVMLLIKLAFDGGIAMWKSFSLLLGLSLTSFLSTYINFYEKEQTVQMIRSETSETDSDSTQRKPNNSPSLTLRLIYKEHVFSRVFISHLLWALIIALHLMFTIASSHIYIEDVAKNNENTDESSLTNILSVALMVGFLPALVAGIYLEVFQHKFKGNLYQRNLKTLIIGIVTVNILSVMMAVMSLFYNVHVVYTNLFIVPVLRGFFYATIFSFVAKMFPSDCFGVLSSLIDLVTYISLLSQKVIIIWLQSSDNAALHIRITFGVLSSLAMFHPIFLWKSAKKTDKPIKTSIEDGLSNEGSYTNQDLTAL